MIEGYVIHAVKGGKGFGPEAVRAAVGKFRRNGFLDDTAFARKLAEQTLERSPAGRAYLVAVLRKKRIGRSLAERTVDLVLHDTDEEEIAVRALQKRWSQYRQLELESARRKAYNYLSRRGIGYAAARAAFDKLRAQT